MHYARAALATAAVAATALTGASASAQVPIQHHVHSGQYGHYVAPTDFNALGDHRVIFGDDDYTWEWHPLQNTFSQIAYPYGKEFDGLAYFTAANADGYVHVWDLQARRWTNLGTGSTPSAYKEFVAWEDSGALYYADLSRGTLNPLSANRPARTPSVFEERVAYAYHDGRSWNVAVHDGANDVHEYDARDHSDELNPDLWSNMVAYERAGGTQIVIEDLSGSITVIPTMPRCAEWRRPRFGGDGTWIAMAGVDCGGVNELWLYEIATGHMQYIDRLWEPEFFNASTDALAYANDRKEIEFILFGRSGAQPTVPVDAVYESPVPGHDPAVIIDHAGDWHAVYTDGWDTIDWMPNTSINSIGPGYTAYDGDIYAFAARDYMTDEILLYDFSTGNWDVVGTGSRPSTYKEFAGWTTMATSEQALGWGTTGGNSGISFDSNGLDEGFCAVFDTYVAYESRSASGDWDIRFGDLYRDQEWYHLARPGTQGRPDLFADKVLFWEFDAGLGRGVWRIWEPNNGSTISTVPLASSCEPEWARFGWNGAWVAYEAICPSGEAEMRVVNLATGRDWFAGYKMPSHNSHPQFGIHEDKLVYRTDDGNIRYLDLNENLL